MTPVEIIAGVLVVLGFLKIAMVYFEPNSWLKVEKAIFENKGLSTLIAFILLLVSGFYLIQVLNPVEIGASAVFIGLLMLVTILLSGFSDDFLNLKKKAIISKDVIKKNWAAVALWVIFLLWILKSMFA